MEENNKYDAQSIDGCKKYLENIITKFNISAKNSTITTEVTAFCTANSFDMSDVNFDEGQKKVKEALISKIPDTDPDHDRKVDDINTKVKEIYERNSAKKEFDEKYRKNVEKTIGITNFKIKEIEDKKEEKTEEIEDLKRELCSIEADIEKIKNAHGGNDPATTDPDFDDFDTLNNSHKECEENIKKLTEELKEQMNSVNAFKKVVGDLKKSLEFQGIKLDTTVIIDPNKEKKSSSKEENGRDGSNQDENAERNDEENEQEIQTQQSQQQVPPVVPQPMPYYSYPQMQQPKTQQVATPKQQGNGGGAVQGTNGQPQAEAQQESMLPALNDVEKARKLLELIKKDKSAKNSYIIKDESEAMNLAMCASSQNALKNVTGFNNKGKISKILEKSVTAKNVDLSARDFDEVKEAFKEFLPNVSDADMDSLLDNIYGDDKSKVSFMSKPISGDDKQKILDLIKALNTKRKSVIPKSAEKAKELSYDSTKQDAIVKLQEKIKLIEETLIMPINLKEAQQQVQKSRTFASRFSKNKGYDSGIHELSEESINGLSQKDKDKAESFINELRNGVEPEEAYEKIDDSKNINQQSRNTKSRSNHTK